MSIRVYSSTGILLDLWDDTTRTYTDFRPTPSSSRAYSATENARADAEAAATTASGNSGTIGDRISSVDMPAMQAIIDAQNTTINAGVATYLKDVARAVRRLDRKVANLLDGTT